MTLQVARARHSDGRAAGKARGVPAGVEAMSPWSSPAPWSSDREPPGARRTATSPEKRRVVPAIARPVRVRGDNRRADGDMDRSVAAAVRRDGRVSARGRDRCRPDVVVNRGAIPVVCDNVRVARFSVPRCRRESAWSGLTTALAGRARPSYRPNRALRRRRPRVPSILDHVPDDESRLSTREHHRRRGSGQFIAHPCPE